MLKHTLAVILMILAWILPFNKLYTQQKTHNKQQLTLINPPIYLSTAIGKPQEYLQLIRYLSELEGGRVKMYVAGTGGQIASAQNIVNAMQSSRAKVDVIVYGNVASASATIALSGDTLQILNPGTIFKLHTPGVNIVNSSGGNEALLVKDYCTLVGGRDRGILISEKCLAQNDIDTINLYSGLYSVNKKLLTPTEWFKHENGNDINLTGQDIYDRHVFNVKLGGTL